MKRRRKNLLAGDMIVVHDGLGALEKAHQNKLRLDGLQVIDSVDIDKCFLELEGNEKRWDFYIGLLKRGAIYVEVHEVSYEELDRIIGKAEWLRKKIVEYGWPEVEGRPLLLAPTAGIPLGAAQDLQRRLALRKMIIVMKGDLISKVLDLHGE